MFFLFISVAQYFVYVYCVSKETYACLATCLPEVEDEFNFSVAILIREHQ